MKTLNLLGEGYALSEVDLVYSMSLSVKIKDLTSKDRCMCGNC